jgi:hypothetical protein
MNNKRKMKKKIQYKKKKSPLKYDLVTGLFTRWVGDVLREHRPQKDILGL